MAGEVKKEVQLKIAHVVFIDIARYSELLITSGNRSGDGLVPFCASHDHVELGSLLARV